MVGLLITGIITLVFHVVVDRTWAIVFGSTVLAVVIILLVVVPRAIQPSD